MKPLIKTLQILLGLWNITGAAYMMQNHLALSTEWAANSFPSIVWTLFGLLQIGLALALILSVSKKAAHLRRPAALGLALISLIGIGIYSEYAGFPGLLWSLIPAALLTFIALKK